MSDRPYEGWALVEQMGFRQTVAQVREVEQFGTKMLRLDVPYFTADDGRPLDGAVGFATRFAGGPSLYQVTPLAEEVALMMARKQADPRPVKPAEFRLAPPPRPFGAPPGERPEEGDDDTHRDTHGFNEDDDA